MINETRIEKYFSQQLSEAELLEFEKQYDTDDAFKREVDFLNNIRSVAKNEEDIKFKNQLASYETEFIMHEKSNSPRRLRILLTLAALLIIALGVTFFLDNNLNNNQLYSKNFEPSKNVSSPIVRSQIDDQVINDAFISYSEGDYDQAIPLFEQEFEITKNSELLFYKGNALLALDQTQEAIEIFKKHISYSDPLTHRTHWYLALAYLKSNQLESAKQQLKIVLNTEESFKKKEARSLLEKLN